MVRTRVGYTGGTRKDPTYRSLGDHTEAFEVEFDPDRISYEDLLDIFWSGHDPEGPQYSVQYRSAVFYHDERQREAALKSRDILASAGKEKITTAVEEAGTFYQAEDYHQKYYLRGSGGAANELRAIYPDPGDFLRSTAVARVNGYLGGNGTEEEVEREIGSLGLSEGGQRRLREYVQSSPRRACPLPSREGAGKRGGGARELSVAP